MIKIDPEKVQDQLVQFIKTVFAKAGFTKAIIGLSGGVDSSTSCVLATEALGRENIYPALLPHGVLNSAGVLDALEVVNWLKIPLINVVRIDIEPVVNGLLKSLPETNIDRLRRGNLMARTRMIYLFDQAKKRQALVVGTENKTEHFLGYFTRFGDEASDLEPLRGLYKSQVYLLAKHLGLPEKILTKAPSAGLWQGQTDEGEFGFSYEQADEILYGLYEQHKKVSDLVASGIAEELIQKVESLVRKNSFKHQLPYLPPE